MRTSSSALYGRASLTHDDETILIRDPGTFWLTYGIQYGSWRHDDKEQSK